MKKIALTLFSVFLSLFFAIGCKGPHTGGGSADLVELLVFVDSFPVSLDEEFSPERTHYSVSVAEAEDVNNYFVYGIPAESGALVEYSPGQSINSPPAGNTVVTLSVTSGISSDVTNEYTVTLCRDGSNNADFESLTVGGTTPTGFSPGEGQESGDPPLAVDVGSTTETIVIVGTAAHPNATVSYSPEPTTGDNTFALSLGENSFTVTITAEDGATQAYYTLVVNRPTGRPLFDALDAESDNSFEPYQFDELSVNSGNDLEVINTGALAGDYSYQLNYGGLDLQRSLRCWKLVEPNSENPNIAEVGEDYAVISGGVYAKALVDIGGMASMRMASKDGITPSEYFDFDILMMNNTDTLSTNCGIRVVVADGAIQGFKAVTNAATNGTVVNLGSLDLADLISGPFWIELGFEIGTDGGAEVRINGQTVYSESTDTSSCNIVDIFVGNRTGYPDSPGSMVIDSIEMQTGDWFGVEPG